MALGMWCDNKTDFAAVRKSADRVKMTQGQDIWFVYDGDCPICSMAARLWRVRKAAGEMHLINAREMGKHPILEEINKRHINLDEGMVLKIGDNFYHGAAALQLMALLGTDSDWFNRINAQLFRSKWVAMLCYPFLRAGRNFALFIKGKRQIRNLASGTNQFPGSPLPPGED